MPNFLQHPYYLKSLDFGARSSHDFNDACARTDWDLPNDGKPGEWKPPVSNHRPLKPHHWGYHLSSWKHTASWFFQENFIAEAGEEVVEGWDCVVAREARLVERLETSQTMWASTAFSFADSVKDLLTLMHFPATTAAPIPRAFNLIQRWHHFDSSVSDREANMAMNFSIMAVGRNAIDSERSYEYSANSMAAYHAAAAVSLLGHLRREDGRSLCDLPPEPSNILRNGELPALKKLWGRSAIAGLKLDSNLEVCKLICSHASKAAECSAKQIERFKLLKPVEWNEHHFDDLMSRHRQWAKHSIMPKEAPMDDHVLSGLRAIQTDWMMRRIFKLTPQS